MGHILLNVITARWLRIIGIIAWLFAGSTSFVRFARGDSGLLVWSIAYIAFGVVFWIGSDRRVTRQRRIASLVAQAVLAIVLAMLGMPHFEGALMALVAGQLPLVVPVWAAIVWALAQVLPLYLSISGRYSDVDIFKSLSSYLAFSAFAVAVVHLFQAERRARVDLAVERERVVIARELHDLLGHYLAGLKIQLDLARRKATGDSRAPLEEAHDVSKEMFTAVREAVERIKRKDVNLREELERIARSPEPQIELHFPSTLVIEQQSVVLVAHRCVMEAVTNVRKHANATRVKISLSPAGDDFAICVEDDGAKAGTIHPGNGLRGMRDRIEELGGTLEVVSMAGKGTTIRARLPREAT